MKRTCLLPSKMAASLRNHGLRLFGVFQTYCSRNKSLPNYNFVNSRSYASKKKKRSRKVKSHGMSIIQQSPEALEALSQFSNPKQSLQLLLSAVGVKNVRIQYSSKLSGGIVQTVLRVPWPRESTSLGIGRSKKIAENMAAALMCSKLKKLGYFNEKNDIQLPWLVSIKDTDLVSSHFRREYAPEVLHLETDAKLLLTNLFSSTQLDKDDFASETSDSDFASEFSDGEFFNEFQLGFEDSPDLTDIVSGRPLILKDESYLEKRSMLLQELRQKQIEIALNNPKFSETVLATSQLPIAKDRESILQKIRNNQVTVLCGDTGCGKTTQVPQFILDDFIAHGEGAKCNIVITQPRRISAISVAERVAMERGQDVGDSVGYQVRLKLQLPRSDGCMFFCTTGILLKRLQGNPSLKGISHIIVDEVHERDINTDFLLILLKRALSENRDLKLIVMSASINAEIFSTYFNSCPIINVPGRMFPVKEYFLPEVEEMVGVPTEVRSSEEEYPDTDDQLIVKLVKFIDRNKPEGAILVFLPGWQDIKNVYEKLQSIWPEDESHVIYPVHSDIPIRSQQQIFSRPKPGVRKIVLATNIAETSITINDVVYVVNSGSHKENRYNPKLGVSCLDLYWISKANMKQRKGRAGRVQPGECYHLFSRDVYENMADYEDPEILRVPLEQIIIMSKIHNPDISALDFLSQGLDPPNLNALNQAVKDLQNMNILDENEQLTPLGKKISPIGAEPKLAKALVYSSIFRCVNPILSIAAGLSTRSPFREAVETRELARKKKKEFAGDSCSDHIAMVNLYNDWDRAMTDWEADYFEDENLVNRSTMIFISGLRRQFAENLAEVGLVSSAKDTLSSVDGSSDFSDENIIKAVLLGSFSPNIIKLIYGKTVGRYLRTNKFDFRDNFFNKVLLSRRSVNASAKKFKDRWFTFFNKMQTERIFVSDSTMVSSLAVLCLCNKIHMRRLVPYDVEQLIERKLISEEDRRSFVKLQITPNSRGSLGIGFYVNPESAKLLLQLKEYIDTMIEECLEVDSVADLPMETFHRHTQTLETLSKLLQVHHDAPGRHTRDAVTSEDESLGDDSTDDELDDMR